MAYEPDVEGAEPQALAGAIGIIQKQRPVLAVSLYHRPVSQHWEIPLWIRNLDLGYRLYCRHHSRYECETVCYAVPERRGFLMAGIRGWFGRKRKTAPK